MEKVEAEIKSRKIYGLMSAVMAEIGPVAKNQRNTQQNYKFRGIDDIYLAVQNVMAKHSIFCSPTVLHDRSEERTTTKGTNLIYRILTVRYDFYAADGSSVSCTVVGEGMDSGDKGSNKALSSAHKYALIQIFCIPTEEAKDVELFDHEPSKPSNSGWDRSKFDKKPMPEPLHTKHVEAALSAFSSLKKDVKETTPEQGIYHHDNLEMRDNFYKALDGVAGLRKDLHEAISKNLDGRPKFEYLKLVEQAKKI